MEETVPGCRLVGLAFQLVAYQLLAPRAVVIRHDDENPGKAAQVAHGENVALTWRNDRIVMRIGNEVIILEADIRGFAVRCLIRT